MVKRYQRERERESFWSIIHKDKEIKVDANHKTRAGWMDEVKTHIKNIGWLYNTYKLKKYYKTRHALWNLMLEC